MLRSRAWTAAWWLDGGIGAAPSMFLKDTPIDERMSAV
jgi:hypothetical protein